MIDFFQYVVTELKGKRLSRPDALALVEQFSRRSAAAGSDCRLHPLIHCNTSDLARQSYRSIFSGEESFLTDHQLRGRKVLPAVAYLEMARAAIADALPGHEAAATLELRNLVWAQPLVVAGPQEVTVELAVTGELGSGGDCIDFEICTPPSASSEPDSLGDADEAPGIVHCRGRAVLSLERAPPKLDLEALRTQMVSGQSEAATLYTDIARVGMTIGPSHRTVKTLYRGEREALVELRLPEAVRGTQQEYVLHPGMMDGVLQAATASIVDLHRHANRPPLPFALEKLQLFRGCQADMVAWVRHVRDGRPGDTLSKLDIDLCDPEGTVCVRLFGFSSRASGIELDEVKVSGEGVGCLLAAPEWTPLETAQSVDGTCSPMDTERHLVLCGFAHIDTQRLDAQLGGVTLRSSRLRVTLAQGNMASRYEEVVLACFEKVQAILRDPSSGSALVQVVIADTDTDTVFAGVSGLLKTATREQPSLLGQVIVTAADIPTESLAAQLQDARQRPQEPLLKYDRGGLSVLRWRALEEFSATIATATAAAAAADTAGLAGIPATADSAPVHAPIFKDHGVYLITGGLGALGLLFARAILGQVREGRVILTGRSAPGTRGQAVLESLSSDAAGDRVCYRQLDLGNLQAVEACIAAVKAQFGTLDGILHCAGMICDAFISKKTPAELTRTLEPKVAGTVHLDEASKGLELDFLALFSAGAAVFGNVGQADYAAANGFMDQFAGYRNKLLRAGQRRGLTLSINWPLWQEGGMTLDRASARVLRRTTGMYPLRTATGLRAFHRCLELHRDQILVVEGDLTQARRALLEGPAGQPTEPIAQIRSAAEHRPSSNTDASLVESTRAYLRKEFAAVLKLPAREIDPLAPLEKYGIDSILAMELTSRLELTFGSLPKTLFFEYRSLGEVAEYFIQSQGPALAALLTGTARDPASAALSDHPGKSAAAAPAALSGGARSGSRTRLRKTRLTRVGSRDSASRAEPIAIVGLSGRYPKSSNIGEYWQNLRDGNNCIVEIPKERWDWRDYYSEDRKAEGCHYSKWGGFIDGVDEFDPLFFSISPVDAENIDPQERLFLQHTWMALEDAGYTRARLQVAREPSQAGQVGVYVGVMYGEYQIFAAEASLRGKRMGLPGSYGSIANRVSYFLNLQGPSLALDTMCSSSLTAIHLACQDLRRGLTSMAIAGGVNTTIHPNKYLALSAGQFISGAGQCQSFGEGGDGYIPGEGVGVVVLKRLSDAESDGDRIYGLIAGSALSHGGKTNGYTVPNPQAQAAAITRALQEAQVDARHVSYIEAHGTGTKLGDPIEMAALSKVFRRYTQEKRFCWIGSVKSNIGHCESAAGVAGLTKVLMQLRHRQIAPSLHSQRLNPHIDFENSPFEVNQRLRRWEAPTVDDQRLPRIAGISSFGAGGSNAHLIVQEYAGDRSASFASRAWPSEADGAQAVLLSARTPEQLRQKAVDLSEFLKQRSTESESDAPASAAIDLRELAHTLQVGREAMDERLALLVSSVGDLREKLTAYLLREEPADVYQGRVKGGEMLAVFSSDEDLQQTVRKWLSARKLNRLLDLWVKGLEVDWSGLYGEGKPLPMSLPAYPFARERYWIDAGRAAGKLEERRGVLHPLLHENTSNLLGQRYRSSFTGDEDLLRDHQVHLGGELRKVMPAAAYMEMVRAGLEQAVPGAAEDGRVLHLLETVWPQAFVVDEPRQLELRLQVLGEEEIEYEVFSQNGEEEQLHCRGRARFSPAGERPASMEDRQSLSPEPRLPIEALRAGLHRGVISSEQVYAAMNRLGLEYGAAHRGIEELHLGEGQLLARLGMPEVVRSGALDYVLHPSLLDAALQATVGLTEGLAEVSGQPRVPIALQRLSVLGRCQEQMIAWIRRSGEQSGAGGRHAVSGDADTLPELDIDLCDLQGKVCVELRGFAARVLNNGPAPALEPIGTYVGTPRWVDSPLRSVPHTMGDPLHRELILCELPQVDVRRLQALTGVNDCVRLLTPVEGTSAGESLSRRAANVQQPMSANEAQRYTEYAVGVLHRLKALLKAGHSGRVLVQLVCGDDGHQSVLAGLSGLLRTAALENPQLTGQVILSSGEVTTQELARQLQQETRTAETLIRYVGSTRQELSWEPLPERAAGQATVFKEGGVYLVTGGLGGLGRLFTQEIFERSPTARVILTGREALDSERQALLASFGTGLPGKLQYRQVDLEDAEQVKALLHTVREEHAELNGIFHIAGMIADRFILDKSEEEFRRVLGPKVRGTYNLEVASRGLDMDFLVLFSSVSGVLGNAGQADYAAANGFMDEYARCRAADGARVFSINWPLWQSGGMQIAAPRLQWLQQQSGMQPLGTDAGLQAFHRCVESGAPRALVMAGELSRLQRALAAGQKMVGTAPTEEPAGAMQPSTATANRSIGAQEAMAGSESSAARSAAAGATETSHLIELTEEYLRRQFAALLKLQPHQIDVQAPLEKYGIDSILVMKLTAEAEKTFGPLSKTLFFEYQTIAALARYFVRFHSQTVRRTVAPESAFADTPQVPKPTLPRASLGKSRSTRRLWEVGETRKREVAIVGVSGRYPLADSLEEFWSNLRNGRDCITEIPQERWDSAQFFDRERDKPGKSYSKWGGFLRAVDEFDPLFFSISPKEAQRMDPQERLFLEIAWQTVEDAGYTKEALSAYKTGVFVGVMWGQYELFGPESIAGGNPLVPTSSYASIANRVSYFLDLHGPSIALDTMCSSSLSAIHLASEAIRRGEIDAAIAGGVNLSLHPQKYLSLSQGNFASSDGRCRSFGAGGDGYVPGEGVGAVFLKPLDQALRDRDHVYAIVKSSSINHGGKTNGYSVPNPNAQGDLILEALAKAKIDPGTVSYIETHGTGTSLGDPIEFTGLSKAFAAGPYEPQRCSLGSVKSNIGHLESAAGIAALTKVLLQLEHGELVPSLHAEPSNPNINFADSPFYVQTRLTQWKRAAQHPRRAAISSFGAGGSNAHVILEEAPVESVVATSGAESPEVFVLSARDAQALARYAQRLVQSLETLGNSTAADIAYTLQCGRTPMTVRLAILSSSLNDFRVKLLQWLQDFETSPAGGNVPDGIYYGNTRDSQLGAGGLLAGETGQSFVSELLARAELAKLASMWTLGVEIDWGKLSRRQMPRRVSLPTYPFTRQRYWIDTQKALLPATAPPVEHLVTPPVKHAVSSDPQTAQVTTMPGLQLASRVTEAGLQSLRSMCLRPDWRASSLEAAGESFEGSILVVDTSDELFVALGEQVAASSRITLACSGNRYQQTGLNRFNIERAKEADYSRLFADLRTQKRFPSVIVLHASEPWSDEDFATLTRAPAGLEAAFRLCKALARQRRAAFPHLLTVFSSDPDRGAPHNSALAGFFKSLALEKPGTRSKIIDIRAAADMLDVGRIASRVWDEMRDRSWIRGDRSQTHEIRYEAGGARFVKEWLECKFPAADTALPLRTGGTYLITGGLGGLGLIFARHLASRYRAQLILTGRSQLSHEGESHLIELRQLGAEVVYFPADVSSYAEIEGVVREGEARFTRLNGVIHAAGIHEDGYFTRKSLDDIIKVLRPKVSGVSNLDRAVGGRDLDFFVAFSSIAGALGNLGQCDYCYANQFLDEYMAVRRSRVGSRRGASISINWPFWDQGGMALSENQRSALASTTGLHPLPTPLGLELFEQMLASRLGHGMPLYGDVTRIRAHLAILSGRGASAAVGSEAVPESVPASAHATEAAPQARAAEAGAGGAGAPPGAIQQTEDYLRDRLAEELHLSAQSIDRQERLDAYGLDSVMINKLMARLQQDLGPVPPTLFYELQTVQEIARYLANAARVARPPGEADRPEQAELLELPEQSMQSVPVAPGTLDQRTPVALSEPFEARQAEEAPERVEPLPAPDLAPNRDMRIAIVGVHGRFPKSQDLHEYWDNLRQGRDLITVVPPDRWDQGELYHPDPAMAADGKIYCKWGGFLDDHDKFDARFFNIAAQDACVIDPQERLMLESAWSAIEDAGYTRESLKRRFPKGKSADVGVFVGVTTNSYQLLLPSRLGPGNAAIPAALPWSIANRISYFFDFRGPSMPVDTACSSSLVAIHLACQSLRNGECQVAIAGGVNLYSHPSKYVSLCQRRMLSAGSRCCSYGAGDDGFVPGEAVGSLVLKPLSRAIEDGDQIYAVIAGSGVDHAGRSNGYSAPNPNSQASLINEVLLASRIHPRTLSYIEGHGTGTQLGDSLEVAALTRAFRAQTDATQFCALGSVKANIGHSESAAGIAAIAKVLLQLKHRQLAPTIHSDEINGHVDLVNSPFYLRHGLADWQEAGDVPRRALINSFGAGGVNSCLIVEEHTSPRHGATGGDGPHLFVLSAQNAERLREYVQRFADWLHSGPRIDPASLCYTLQTGREPMAERLACVIGDLAELAERLDGWLEGATENSYRGCVDPESMPAINAEVLSGLDSSTQLTTERLNDIARSWASGHSVRWEELYGSDKPLRVSLPTYPFARERHWVQNESTAQHRADAEFGAVLHPFISSNSSTLREVSFSSWLTDAGFPAQDHRINGTPILPGAAFLEIACIAGTIAGERSVRLARDVVWMKPVSFEGGARALRTFLKQIGETVEFAVTSLDDDGEREVYCEGRLFYNGNPESEAQPRCSIPTFKNRAVESLAGAEFYQAMARQGFRYGPGFQSLQELFIGTDFALSRLRIPSHLEHEHEQFMLHPSLLDGALQTAAALVRAAGGAEPHLPFALDELEVVRSIPRTCYVLAQPASADSRSVSGIRCFDIRLVTERGEPLVALRNLYVRELQALQPSHAGTISSRSK